MRVLDLTCGRRGIWFDKSFPGAVYLDIRPEVAPDVVADARALPAEIGDCFDLVVFDPPHVNGGAKSNISRDYGHHTTAQIRDLIERGASEAHRVTRHGALMSFKWSDHDQSFETVLELLARWWKPLFGTTTAVRTKHACSTQWIMLARQEAA